MATAIVVVPVGSVVNKDDDVAAVHVVVVVAVVHAVFVFVVVVLCFESQTCFLKKAKNKKKWFHLKVFHPSKKINGDVFLVSTCQRIDSVEGFHPMTDERETHRSKQ